MINTDAFFGKLVDMHCHVDLYPSPSQIVSECDSIGIRTVAVTTTPKAWPGNKRFINDSTWVRPALGFHPELVSERSSELDLFRKYLPEAKYVGEIGLDGRMPNNKSLGLQREILSEILVACSQESGKILSLHGVRAWSELIDLLERHLDLSSCRTILHWFTGSKKQLERAINIGCYFSLNSKSFQSKNCQNVLKILPIERVLTETDGPFINAGRRTAHPADVSVVVKKCAQFWNITPNEAARIILNNCRQIVSV